MLSLSEPENKPKLIVHNLWDFHSEEELKLIVKQINKFLQSDSPAKAIFNLNEGFGMKMFRKTNNDIEVHMVYDSEDI